MKLINQSAEYLPQSSGIEGIYKAIELAGRTSYLSWDKMTDGSAKKFVDMLIKSKHTSVLEHGTVYLRLPLEYKGHYTQKGNDEIWNSELAISKYHLNSYSIVNTITEDMYLEATGGGKYLYPKGYYITTNLRVLQENGWLDDLQYLCEPTEFHEKRLSVKVVTSRSISHELVRHRSMSFIQESQRYVGYDKNRYNAELMFIKPSWLDKLSNGEEHSQETGYSDMFTKDDFINCLKDAQNSYIAARVAGLQPQEAREILPNATKTTLVITAFESDWREWFSQRLFGKTGTPHPDMLVLANLIKQEFEKAGVWEEIMKYPSKYE